tara:strand:- start:1626 stop:2762 length:1137 start_codon:yes stop_codon:yes gene_type:complete
MKKVYLDNAATTQINPKVIDEMVAVLENSYGNPSSTHFFGRDSKTIIELSRKFIANTFNAKPKEIFFTSGGTESNNMIIKSCIKHGVERIITTKIEHKAVLNPILSLYNNQKVELEFLSIDCEGNPDLNELKSLLSKPKKTLVSLMHINNEIGTMIDLESIGSICHSYNALFHSDTVQTIGHYPLDLSLINIDFITCSAHKFHGPKGVGFTYINEKNKAFPLIEGGEQERGLRAGTESTHNIHGLKIALEEAYKNLSDDQKKVKSLKELFLEKIHESIENVEINGNFNKSSYTILNLRFPIPNNKKDLINFKLELAGIACSSGSACQSGSSEPSHVLSQILSQEEIKKISIRFSFSKFNSKNEIIYAADSIKKILSEF